MSIASEIQRIKNDKANLKTALESKGVVVPENASLDTYATLVGEVPTSSEITNGKIQGIRAYTNLSKDTFVQYHTASEVRSWAYTYDKRRILRPALYKDKIVALYSAGEYSTYGYLGLFSLTSSGLTLLNSYQIGYKYTSGLGPNAPFVDDNVILFRATSSSNSGVHHVATINDDDTITYGNGISDKMDYSRFITQCTTKVAEDDDYKYYLEIMVYSYNEFPMGSFYYKYSKSTKQLTAITQNTTYNQKTLPSQSRVYDYGRWFNRAILISVNNTWYCVTANDSKLNLFQITVPTDTDVTYTYKSNLTNYAQAVLTTDGTYVYALYPDSGTSTLKLDKLSISDNSLSVVSSIDTNVSNSNTSYTISIMDEYILAYIDNTGLVLIDDTSVKQTFTNSSLTNSVLGNPINQGRDNDDMRFILNTVNSNDNSNLLTTVCLKNGVLTAGDLFIKSSTTSIDGLLTEDVSANNFGDTWVLNN